MYYTTLDQLALIQINADHFQPKSISIKYLIGYQYIYDVINLNYPKSLILNNIDEKFDEIYFLLLILSIQEHSHHFPHYNPRFHSKTREIIYSEQQLLLLVAQYLRSRGHYQTLFTLQNEAESPVPLCSPQIDVFNSLFMSNQFNDCANFLKKLVINGTLRQLVARVQLLDKAVFGTQQELAKSAAENESLVEKKIMKEMFSLNAKQDHKLFNQIKLELFQDIQEFLYPYYNQYAGVESVFQTIPPERLEKIITGYYNGQLKQCPQIKEQTVSVNLFEDLAPVIDATPTKLFQSEASFISRQLSTSVQNLPNLQNTLNISERLNATTPTKLTQSQLTTTVENSQPPQTPVQNQQKLEDHSIQLSYLKRQSNSNEAQVVQKLKNQLQLLSFTEEKCSFIRKYEGSFEKFLMIDQNFFFAFSFNKIELFDINFNKSIKTFQTTDKIIDVCADQQNLLLLAQNCFYELDLNSFTADKRILPFKMAAGEKVLKIYPGTIITNMRYYHDEVPKFYDFQGKFPLEETEFLFNNGVLIINCKHGLYFLTLEDGNTVVGPRNAFLNQEEE
ncbi:Conserved_hypothetical protein [Hexamita inflata]|uniref:LisH domain-containing protein n=1 Tax=Hexamita inflata TaxID=28002 RepID=A0AA86TFJ2_9EUKA|nr:Conserved hypothetical protein [Hexamita inflata]